MCVHALVRVYVVCVCELVGQSLTRTHTHTHTHIHTHTHLPRWTGLPSYGIGYAYSSVAYSSVGFPSLKCCNINKALNNLIEQSGHDHTYIV